MNVNKYDKVQIDNQFFFKNIILIRYGIFWPGISNINLFNLSFIMQFLINYHHDNDLKTHL